jgi:hypothetical protein
MPVTRKIVGVGRPKRVVKAAAAQLTYNGGPLLANVEVTTIYWGSAWNTDPLMAQLEGFFNFVVGSSLLDQLGEYSVPGFTIGHGKHVACAMDASDPGATVDDSAIQAKLQGWIASGLVPAQGPNSLYFIFTPSGTTVTLQGSSSCVDFCGYHNTPDGNLFYAVVPYADCPGCQFAGNLLDSMTVIASHELCEGITDPGIGSGWADNNTGFEIGDICEGSNKTISAATPLAKPASATTFNVSVSPASVTVDGTSPVSLSVTLTPAAVTPPPPPPPPPPPTSAYVVQTEWSNAQGRCV